MSGREEKESNVKNRQVPVKRFCTRLLLSVRVFDLCATTVSIQVGEGKEVEPI